MSGLHPELRASDAERTASIERLREARVEGRLTLDEFTERADLALSARTRSDLEVVTRDLPVIADTAPIRSRRRTRWVIAVIGEVVRNRRWRPGRRLVAICTIGELTLDLRQAEIVDNEITIFALLCVGEITVIVPEGVDVELSGLVVIGSKSERGADSPSRPGAPLVRVIALGAIGEITVLVKPGRRALAPPG
jgi:hypothetical protein